MRRKYELGSKYGSVHSWKEKSKMRKKDCEEEVSRKTTLKWHKLAKNGAGVERYLRSVQGQEIVKLMFILRTGSSGLLDYKKSKKRL